MRSSLTEISDRMCLAVNEIDSTFTRVENAIEEITTSINDFRARQLEIEKLVTDAQTSLDKLKAELRRF